MSRRCGASIVQCLLLLQAVGLVAEEPPDDRAPAGKWKMQVAVRIASQAELRADSEAAKTLATMLSNFTRSRRRHSRGGLTKTELEQLIAFAEKHPSSRAALAAKYLIPDAIVFTKLRAPLMAPCRDSLDEIVREYPSTREAKLSRLSLAVIAFTEEGGQSERGNLRQRMQRLRNALRAALPVVKEIDEDTSPVAAGFRCTALGGRGPKLVPWVKLDLAGIAQALGEDAKAKRLYRDIVRAYPKTECARNAERGLRGMEVLEQVEDDGLLK